MSGSVAASLYLAPLHEPWDVSPNLQAASSHAVQPPADPGSDNGESDSGGSYASYLGGLCAPESLSKVLCNHRDKSVTVHALQVLEDFDREVSGMFNDCRSELRDVMDKVRNLRSITTVQSGQPLQGEPSPTGQWNDFHSPRSSTPPEARAQCQRFLLSEVSRAAGDWAGVLDRQAEWREQRRRNRRRTAFLAAPVVFVPRPEETAPSRPARKAIPTTKGEKMSAFDSLPLVRLHDSVVPVWTLGRRGT